MPKIIHPKESKCMICGALFIGEGDLCSECHDRLFRSKTKGSAYTECPIEHIHKKDLVPCEELDGNAISIALIMQSCADTVCHVDAKFATANQGRFAVRFSSDDQYNSKLYIRQYVPNAVNSYLIVFPVEKFDEMFLKLLQRQQLTFKTTKSFYGGDLVLQYLNQIIASYPCTKGRLKPGEFYYWDWSSRS